VFEGSDEGEILNSNYACRRF